MRAAALSKAPAAKTTGTASASQPVRPPAAPAPHSTRRQCACGGGCPRCTPPRPPDQHEREAISTARKLISMPPRAPASSDEPLAAITPTPTPNAQLASGRPLPAELQQRWGSELHADLSTVRIYDGPVAARLAAAEHAKSFAWGNHIVLGGTVAALHQTAGQAVVAHEIAHTLQQAAESPLPGFTPASLAIQRLDLTVDDIQNAATGAWNTVAETPGQIYDAAVETAEDVANFGYEQLMDLLREYAPEFVAFLEAGPVDYLKDQIFNTLDAWFGGLLSQIQNEGLVETLRSLFGDNFGAVATIAGDLRAGNCESFFQAVSAVIDFADTTFGPLFDTISELGSEASDFFGDLWGRFGQQVVDFIGDVGGEFWDTLVELATDFWDSTADIRETFAELWQEFKDAFNLVWDEGVGIVGWLTELAGEAWDSIKEALGPALVPLEILAGALLLFSPLGPVVAAYASWQAISYAMQWISDNWGDIKQFFIDMRETLANEIFPAIVGALEAVALALGAATDWLGEQIDAIVSALYEIAGALGLVPLLALIADGVAAFADLVSDVAGWIADTFTDIVDSVKDTILAIHTACRPFYGLVLAILVFPTFPFALPIVLAGWFWRLLPDCMKEPIIDWVIGIMIPAIESLPEFANYGQAWPHAKAEILSTLRRVAALPGEQKIAASNRIAKMMTLEDVEWIGNLVEAAIDMPDHFVGQMEEELIGMDLTQPLPFEPQPGAMPMAAMAGIGAITSPAATLSGPLAGGAISPDQVGVTSVGTLQLEPELVAGLNLPDGGEIMFGERPDDFASLATIRAEFAATPPPEADAGAPASPEITDDMTPEEVIEARLQALIDQPMGDECPGKEQPPAPAEPQAVPPELQIGPLTQAQRGRYMFAQMRKGLGKWWDCNREWLLPSLFVAIVALIALEILTGGAVTAALPPLMEIITAIMIGVAAIRSAYYLGDYIAKAAPGDIAGGAKSLARGIAVAAVELIFALLFNIGAVIKSLRGGLRAALRDAAAAAKTFGRTTVAAARRLRDVARTGLQTAKANVRAITGVIMREGRLIFEGISGGFGRGIRSLRDLAQRLWQRLRFRRFSLSRTGHRFFLWGHFNPKVLLASGDIVDVDRAALGLKGRSVVGREVKVAGQTGIVVAAEDAGSVLTGLLENPVLRNSRFGEELFELFMQSNRRGRAELNRIAVSLLAARDPGSVRAVLDSMRALGHTPQTLERLLVRAFDLPGLSPDSLLRRLGRLARFDPDGIGRLISDLLHSWPEKYMGAEWILRWLTSQGDVTIAAIRAFEDAAAMGGRFYDVVIGNLRYEFKNIARFNPDVFIRQIARDYANFGGSLSQNLRWVFSPRIGGRQELIQQMIQHLRRAGQNGTHGLTPVAAQRIIDQLEHIIIVG